MRKVVGLLLLMAYFVVFLNTNAAASRTNGAGSVTVSHETPHAHQEKPHCPDSHQHSHELAIGGHAAHTPLETRLEKPELLATSLKFSAAIQRAPQGPILHGIFRPPIAHA